MGTKSNRSSGTQHNPKGVTQGVTLIDPKTGNPIDTVEDSQGVKRLAVDANFTAQNVQATVELDYNEDSVQIGDPNTGATMVVNEDGSIDANVEIDAGDGDNIAISDGEDVLEVNSDGSININNRDHNGNPYTILNPLNVALDAEDSFNRIKVAPPHLLFDASFQYSLQDEVFIFEQLIGGTVTHNPTRAVAVLTCTSTTGSKARFRTRNYFPYSPAFTNTLIGSFNFHGIVPNVHKRLGLYDDQDGFFIQTNAGTATVQLGIRSSIGGTTTNNLVDQSFWNIDKMDGTGPSGVTLDWTKQQILFLQFQWLGTGRATFGFVIDGKTIRVHTFDHANKLTSLYSRTGTLPIFAEVTNDGSILGSYMEFTCCSLVANGAVSQHGHLHSISSGTIPKALTTAGTSIPIISLRKAPGFTKIPVQILDMEAFCTSNDDFLVQIVHKPVLNGAVWTNITHSVCQKDTSATSYTGGHIIAEFYLKGNLQPSVSLESIARFWDLTLGNDFAGDSEIFSLVATALTANATLYGTISYKEYE